jgi:DNA mismatch endonuclease (patch repair protein)
MSDIFTKKKRSEIMSKIRATETKPEKIVRKFLFAKGFRFRIYLKSLPGKPDIVLPKYKTAIFIHGCFWHGHKNCKAATLPQTRRKFWTDKINDNKKRDAKNYKDLKKSGWKVITIWQCQIKNKSRQKRTLNLLIDKIIN